MPLQPEHHTGYWPLLLTDDLYLLAQDALALRQQAAAGTQQQPADSAPPEPEVIPARPAAALEKGAEPSAREEQKPVQAQPDLLWGSLDKGILILVNYPQHPLIDRPDGLFLVEVLKAVGFDFKEVATLNVSRCKTAADWTYINSLPCSYVLSFGVQLAELPFTQKGVLYQQVREGEQLLLLAENLGQIRQEVSSKKKLWNLLREVFV